MKALRPGPSEIQYKNCRFLITDRPTLDRLDSYVGELQSRNVHELVRVCEATYEPQILETQGIHVSDLAFDDGSPPPASVVDSWLQLLLRAFQADPGACVAVHCVAGLGRAPVLVAVALIELGMLYEDAVILIRQKRRGAINAKQLDYLERYRPRANLKRKLTHSGSKCCMQ